MQLCIQFYYGNYTEIIAIIQGFPKNVYDDFCIHILAFEVKYDIIATMNLW